MNIDSIQIVIVLAFSLLLNEFTQIFIAQDNENALKRNRKNVL